MSTCIEIYSPGPSPYSKRTDLVSPKASPYGQLTAYSPKTTPYLPFCFQITGYLFQDGTVKSFMDGQTFEFN